MKIIDSFIFYNELDLLEIRLAELDNVVDLFVLVESTKTFQNEDKPLYYNENKARFLKYSHKINHIIVDDMPDINKPFELEAHQRNAIMRGLGNCAPEDQIIVSDVDEIPKAGCVVEASRMQGFKAFRQQLFYYFINCECIELNDLPWSIMCEFEGMEKPQKLRDRLVELQGLLMAGSYVTDNSIQLIEEAGWHFSYLGGLDAIKKKIKSFSHVEYNNQEYLDDEKILQAINRGSDLFDRDYHFNYVSFDENFPRYIHENYKKFKHLLRELV